MSPRLYVVIRGTVHPMDAPQYSATQIVGWVRADSALEAATALAESDRHFDTYTAWAWCGTDYKQVHYIPGRGVDPDPEPVAIG